MINFAKRIHYDAQAFMKSMLWEFKLIFRDKAVFFSFIGVAILVSFIYGFVYSKEVLENLPIAVVDNDNTTHSRQLLRMINASQQVEIQGYYSDFNEAKKSFNENKTRGVLVIPKHFSKTLQRSEQPSVSIYADASYMLYYKQFLTAVKTSVSYLNAGVQIKKKSAEGNLPQVAKNKALPVRGKVVSLFNPNTGYGTFLIPIVLMVIFQTTMLTAIGILGGTMREGNKMAKMYPHANSFLGTLPIVMGKATTYLVLSLMILSVMLGVVLPLYGIKVRTSWLNIIVFMIPFLLSIVYLGIFLTSFFKRREDAILWIMFSSIPAMMVTGFSWPMEAMPTWVSVVSHFAPSTLGAKGFIALSQMGADFSIIKTEWLMMWGLCIFYLVLAILSSKRIYLGETGE